MKEIKEGERKAGRKEGGTNKGRKEERKKK